MKNIVFFCALGVFTFTSLSAEECAPDCDIIRCLYKGIVPGGGVDNCYQFKVDCAGFVNTDDPEGTGINGTIANEIRDASCVAICDPFHHNGATVMGLAGSCSSNKDYRPFGGCAEECTTTGCTGHTGPLCAPTN